MSDVILHTEPLGFPWKTQDPFLFCAYHLDAYPAGNPNMTPKASLAGRNLGSDFSRKDGWSMYHGQSVPGFPKHPHRGFETVTVVRNGVIDHADSMGANARFGAGDVQWMTAGSGISHSEMFPLRDTEGDNPLELFQIWLNLPRINKMVPAYFRMFWGHEVPERVYEDDAGHTTTLRVIAGSPADLPDAPAPPPDSWASDPRAAVRIWTVVMQPGAQWTLPPAGPGAQRTLYFFRGDKAQVGGRKLPSSTMIALRPESEVQLRAGDAPCEFLLLEGRPIGEPVVHHGPFVMNTATEIHQAYADYRRGGFGAWPWPSDAPVHERGRDKFAQHADGRVETPKD